MFYVYEHIRLDTNAVFYVGKGKGRRCFETRRRNQHWNRVVSKASGFDVRIVVDKMDEELAFLVEQELIGKYKLQGQILTNITDGGEGMTGHKVIWTSEMKDKIRVANSKRIITEATREKLRLALKARDIINKKTK